MESDCDYGVPIPGDILPAEAWAKTALKKLPPPAPLDWTALFERAAPVVLDLGCGNGRFLVSHALRHPEFNHLGLDILPLVIRYATRRANQRGLHHTRLAVCGAHEFLEGYVAPHSIAQIHLYHPQPYRDNTLSHKRLITPEFLAIAHRSLEPGGTLTFQTDNHAYWTYLSQIAPAFFDVKELTGVWPDSPRGRTRREIYARQHRMPVYKAECTAKPLADDEVARLVTTLPLPAFNAKKKPKAKRRN